MCVLCACVHSECAYDMCVGVYVCGSVWVCGIGWVSRCLCVCMQPACRLRKRVHACRHTRMQCMHAHHASSCVRVCMRACMRYACEHACACMHVNACVHACMSYVCSVVLSCLVLCSVVVVV